MLVCQVVIQPVIRLVQVVVASVEYVLVQICRLVEEIVSVVTRVAEWVCNTVTKTVCGSVCSVVCGICDLFCGIFGCDCGCENVCKNVCNTVSELACGWTYILKTVLQAVTKLVCNYVLHAFIVLLHLVEAIVTMVLTWVCSLIDNFVRWLLCWLYIAEIFDNTDERRLKVAPKVVPNDEGHSDWFVYVNNPAPSGAADQAARGYILSDTGAPLLPSVDPDSGSVTYFEVETRENLITGHLSRGRDREPVAGRPFLYYPYKVMEIASHMFGDIFASGPADDGRGTDFKLNLFTYNPHVQALLDADKQLASNNYNNWRGKYANPGTGSYFGDRSIADMGTRVDTDDTCSHPTNTFLQLVNDHIELTPCNTAIAETMACDAGQAVTFEETNFLMLNKDGDAGAITTYFVTRYRAGESQVGCNEWFGYTVVTFNGADGPLFTVSKVLPFSADRRRMMASIVENVAPMTGGIARVAETYLHECGHQCGLLHDDDAPDCENDTTLHISKVMDPDDDIRRAFTRVQWCMVRSSPYVTQRLGPEFMQAPELPEAEG